MSGLIITILMTVTAYAGSIFGMRYSGMFHKIISFGLAITIMLTWAGERILSTISLLLLAFLAVLTTLYGIIVRNLNFTERISISTIGFLILADTLFKIQHWAGISYIQVSLLIPVLFYIISLWRKPLTRELSFMAFWFILSTIQLLNLARLNLT